MCACVFVCAHARVCQSLDLINNRSVHVCLCVCVCQSLDFLGGKVSYRTTSVSVNPTDHAATVIQPN